MNKGVVSILSGLVGAAIGAGAVGKTVGEKREKAQAMSNKHLALYLLMNQWVKVKQEGKCLATYLAEKDYKKIAIYGMSYVGETLLLELKDSEIEIAYAIDRNADKLYADVDIVSVDDDLEKVDAIVVTAITFFDEIEEVLSSKIDCPIISIEDILYEM